MCIILLAICFNKFLLCPLNNIIDLFKGYKKKIIDLKFEINLTGLTKKFINNKLKPKQHPKTNPRKTQTKNKKK